MARLIQRYRAVSTPKRMAGSEPHPEGDLFRVADVVRAVKRWIRTERERALTSYSALGVDRAQYAQGVLEGVLARLEGPKAAGRGGRKG